jgi:CBS domain containing-hemolysin-like protein
MDGGPGCERRVIFVPFSVAGLLRAASYQSQNRRRDERLDPPEQIWTLALSVVPALIASVYSAASAVFGNISHTRRVALLDSLGDKPRAALERYLAHSSVIEARWLVLRVLGVAGSAIAIQPRSPVPAALFTILVVLGVYAVPSQVLSALSSRVTEQTLPSLLGFLRPLELMVAPIAAPLTFLSRLVARKDTEDEREHDTSLTETEVEILVNEGELNGSLDHDQSEMIRNVLDFGDVQAGDVMLPRMQVSAIAVDTNIKDVLRIAAETGYSRYPVYRDRIDNVVGFLHVKDLVTRANVEDLGKLKVTDLMRTPVVYVPETQSASSVLAGMRAGKHHIAIVIDEFGGTAGIITLEDIIERIVGDIRDEHDDPEKAPPIVELGEGRLLVDARVTMAGLSRHLGVELPEGGDYYSLGGFIVEALGQVPRQGAILNKLGFEFIVREADERHITQVEVIPGAEVAPRISSRPSRPRPAA